MKQQAISLSDSIVQKLYENYQKNIDFLERYYPPLFDMVTQKGNLNVEIDVTPSGEVEICKNGKKLSYYSFDDIKNRVEDFYREPTRIARPVDDLDNYERKCLHIETLKAVGSLSKKYVSRKNACIFNKFDIPLMVIFGIGSGFHLQAFTEFSRIRYLILVEEDLELFKVSLYTINWQKILKNYVGQKNKIFIFISHDREQLVKDVLQSITTCHPMFASLAFYFKASDSQMFDDVLDELGKKQFLMHQGWGFFDDELCSVVQTISKIKRQVPVFSARKKVPEKSVAFIVGSGPSIDKSINILKQYKDDAVIFSCGTGLKILEREGIRPDFHVELERPKITYDVLNSGFNKEYLKGLHLIGSNPVYPKVLELFGQNMIFLKQLDAATFFFNDTDYQIMELSSPTVTNAALSVALHGGFDHIYFFGVDLGWRDPAQHHSEKSLYFDDKHFLSRANLSYHWKYEDDLGTVYTTNIFSWTHNNIEQLIEAFGNRKFFQVGNGANIKGSTRIMDKKLPMPARSTCKKDVLRIFYQNADNTYVKTLNIKRKLKYSRRYFDKFTGAVLGYMDKKKISTRQDFINFACFRHAKLKEIEQKDFHTFMLFRGTLWHLENFIYVYSHQVLEDEKARLFLKDAMKIYRNFILSTRNIFDQLVKIASSKETADITHNEDTYYFV